MPETPSVYFPDYTVEFHFVEERGYAVREVEFSNRRRQASLLDPTVRRRFEGRIPAITFDAEASIREFLDARSGPFQPFYIFAWQRRKFTDYLIGTGDGVAGGFLIPFFFSGTGDVGPASDGFSTSPQNVELINVKVDGVGKTRGSAWPADDYTVGGVIDHDYQTSVQFFAGHGPPALGAEVTATVIGRERIAVKLDGNVVRVEHPLRRAQTASGPADFYVIPVIEVF